MHAINKSRRMLTYRTLQSTNPNNGILLSHRGFRALNAISPSGLVEEVSLLGHGLGLRRFFQRCSDGGWRLGNVLRYWDNILFQGWFGCVQCFVPMVVSFMWIRLREEGSNWAEEMMFKATRRKNSGRNNGSKFWRRGIQWTRYRVKIYCSDPSPALSTQFPAWDILPRGRCKIIYPTPLVSWDYFMSTNISFVANNIPPLPSLLSPIMENSHGMVIII
jgi:hypothetical protein